MASVRIKLNLAGFNEFRNSAPVVALLEDAGAEIEARAEANNQFHTQPDAPFRVTTVHNRSRAVTFVATNNFDGILAEATDRALSKGIG